jgi:hypothetical protein
VTQKFRLRRRADSREIAGMRDNSQANLRRELVRSVADFGLVMGLVWLLSLAAAIHHGRTFFVVSLSIATMAALDLAFLRHLRRVYASPRRGVWRRD